MRIAIVSTTLPPEGKGGAEAYAALLAQTLAIEHEVLVLSGASCGLSGIETVQLPSLAPVTPSTTQLSKLVFHARDQWMPSVHVATSRALRRFAPDVVHTHEPQGLSAAVFTAIDRVQVPHVHTAHDLNLMCARVSMTRDGKFCGGRCALCQIQRIIRGGAFRRHVSYLIAVSDYIRRRHVEARIVPPERALTIYLGATPPTTRVREVEDGKVRLAFLGTLAAHKGVRTLLDAFARAPESWRLQIAGSGPLEPDVLRAVRTDSRISYFGRIDGGAKEAFLDDAHLLLIPSEWEEPGAFVAWEACARGIPCVVSDRGFLPEVPEVKVFRSGEPQALLDAVRWFVDRPERLAAASGRLVAAHEEYSWEAHVRKVEDVLTAAASGS